MSNNQTLPIKALKELDVSLVFSQGGLQPILDAIEAEVTQDVADVSTVSGRKAIASNAHNVARAKVVLDGLGKQLADDLNRQLNPINQERKLARDFLDVLKRKVRNPLTEWECEEARKEAEEKARLEAIQLAEKREADHEIALLLNNEFDRNREEAQAAHEAAEKALQIEQQQREEALKREAAITAKREAERKAKQREAMLVEQKEQAERAKIAAEKKAELDAQVAIEKERRRVAEEQLERERKQAAKAANQVHRQKIHQQAKAGVMKLGFSEEQSVQLITAIRDHHIQHVSITY